MIFSFLFWFLKNKRRVNVEINPILIDVLISYFLKTPEIRKFSGVFRGY